MIDFPVLGSKKASQLLILRFQVEKKSSDTLENCKNYLIISHLRHIIQRSYKIISTHNHSKVQKESYFIDE